MDSSLARRILRRHLERYRSFSYQDLRRRIGSVETQEVRGANGVLYQLEIQFFWDGEPNGNVRVIGSIDDGGLRAFVPLSDDFILSPSGRFVGE